MALSPRGGSSPFGSQSVENTSEIQRIAALPRRVWTEEEGLRLAEEMTKELKTKGGTKKLRSVQAVSLLEMMEVGGAFCPQRVGAGKSLTSYLAPAVLEARRPILLLPASLVQKSWNERRVWSEHFHLPTNLQLISYESLGLVQNERRLEYILPDLIVADECHFLKSSRAGRTRRIARYMHAHPETKFVALSGTVLRSSLMDLEHIMRWCLKDRTPLPATKDEVTTWAEALDEKVNPMSRRRPGALMRLGPCPEGATDEITAARRVFQSRLLETRGVVASSKTDGVTCSIRVQALEYQLSTIMEGHFHTLRTLWETPCGKAFSEATEFRMHARELGLGFSYTWVAREKIAEWESLLRQSRKQSVPFGNESTDESTPTERPLRTDVLEKSTCPSALKETESITQITENTSSNMPGSTARDLRSRSTKKSTIRTTTDKIGGSPESTPPNSSLLDLLPINDGERTTKKNSLLTNLPDQKHRNAEKSPSMPHASAGTGSPPRSIRRSSIGVATVVRFAERKCAAVEGAELLTTITQQERSEDCFAQDATEQSGYSEISLGLSGPMLTFLEQNRAPQEWLNARREWCSFVREQIAHSQKYDTMLQVANACDAGVLLSVALDAWREIEPTYKPLTRAVFHDTTALEVCIAWMKREKGIVWVEHRAFGEALSRLTGAPYYGAGGLDANGVSVADAKPGKAIICSIAAVGQGFNLQMFSKALITSCPSGAATVEQVLGRIHRDGQEADEVVIDVLLGCAEHAEAFERAVDGARAAEEMLGHRQKLCLADIVFERPNKKGPLWT